MFTIEKAPKKANLAMAPSNFPTYSNLILAMETQHSFGFTRVTHNNNSNINNVINNYIPKSKNPNEGDLTKRKRKKYAMYSPQVKKQCIEQVNFY